MRMKIIKKLLCMFVIIVLCLNSFAAVVSDNDGNAFITKEEFDNLKNDFNKQIEQYNESIDSKIDSAIASYLAGTMLSTVLGLDNLILEDKYFIKTATTMECSWNAGYKWKIKMNYGVQARTDYTTYGMCWWEWRTNADITTVGTQTLFYLGTVNSDNSLSIQNKLKSWPIATAMGSQSFAMADRSNTNQAVNWPELRMTPDTWSTGMSSVNYGPTVCNYDESVTATTAWNFEDTYEEFEKNELWGGSVPTTTFYFVKNTEIASLDNHATHTNSGRIAWQQANPCDSLVAHGNCKKHALKDYTFVGEIPLYIGIYSHKFYDSTTTDTKATWDLVRDDETTTAYGSVLYKYSGMPICKINNDGKLKFNLKFTDTYGRAGTYYIVQQGEFDKDAIETTGPHMTRVTTPGNVYYASNGDTVQFEINVKQGKALFIKCNPEEPMAHIKVSVVGDIALTIN